jgi:hypothetical protein
MRQHLCKLFLFLALGLGLNFAAHAGANPEEARSSSLTPQDGISAELFAEPSVRSGVAVCAAFLDLGMRNGGSDAVDWTGDDGRGSGNEYW